MFSLPTISRHPSSSPFFFFNDTATTEIYTLSLHDALPICYRLYGTEHLKRLNFIRRARTLGFSVGEVRTLLRLADEPNRAGAQVRGGAEAHLTDGSA